jgi:hypothetical protein
MEMPVNSTIGWVISFFDVVRSLPGFADKALLTGVAVAAGAYVGTRMALAPPKRRADAPRSSGEPASR